MLNVRQSIVNRPAKAPTCTNDESMDKEFQKELSALHMKQEQYTWKLAEVRQSVSPQRVETLKRQAHMKAEMEEQLRMKEACRQQLMEEEKKFYQYNAYLRRFSGAHSVEEDIARQQQRKEYLKGLMNENIRLSTLKRELNEKQRELEAEMDRIRATTHCTWNRRHYL